MVLIERDNPVEAAAHLEHVARQQRDHREGHAAVREHAAWKLRELDARVLAKVAVTCRTEGAKIYVDGGTPVLTVEQRWCGASSCLSMTRVARVKAGAHLFVAEMPRGEAPVVVGRYLAPGETVRIELAPPRTYRRRWKELTWQPWAVTGGGALLWLAGGALQRRASASYRELEEKLDDCWRGGRSCDLRQVLPEHARLRDRGDTLRALGLASYGIAGAAVATGAALLYLNRRVPDRSASETAAPTRSPRRRLPSVAPIVGAGIAGAIVMGRF